ncbi:acyltransferase family protein [Deefgea tanakiae]|uniref:Acyltransferase family protein n=1 Tax=Deefgea tanakiae TaxID=2865840 RepID=A0ABX8Z8Y3_9NEIS|nr:acyltransferase family protein [Deefgea tanakiae]QZA78245.1 acyltransferase family protein [Deefgea tanakiae]
MDKKTIPHLPILDDFVRLLLVSPIRADIYRAKKIIQTLILGYRHLWYLAGLIVSALLLLTMKNFKSLTIASIAVATFLLGVLIQYTGNYHLAENKILDTQFNYDWVHRNGLLFSLPYISLGYLINKHEIHKKISLTTAVTASIVGLMLLTLESNFNYSSPINDKHFDNMLSLAIICPAIFLLFMKINIQGRSKNIALYSSGVFFIHPFVIYILGEVSKLQATALTIATIFISLIASYFLIKINRKLKFIL